MSQSPQQTRPIRAFISYSHDDTDLASKVAAHLETLGAKPMYDKDIRGGTPFREEIRWRYHV